MNESRQRGTGIVSVLGAALLTCGLVAPVTAQTIRPCAGDCDANLAATGADLLALVNIALGQRGAAACGRSDADADGAISAVEVVAAVRGALAVCQLSGPPAAEAATGVEAATVDAVQSLDILDFGFIGVFAAGASSATTGTVAAFPACPDGGSVDFSCDSNANTLSAHFTDCRSGATIRSGSFMQTVGDASFCTGGVIPATAPVALTLRDYTEIDAGTGATTTAAELNSTFAPADPARRQQCAIETDEDITDGSESIDGSLRVVAAGKDVTYHYTGFSIDTHSTDSPCMVTRTANGTLDVDDRTNNRRLTEVSENFMIASTAQADHSRLVTEQGRLLLSCLGTADFDTLEPLHRAAGAGCPDAGRLAVTLQGAPARVELRFTPTGGIDIDVNGDTIPDVQVSDCHDAALAQCAGVVPPTIRPLPTQAPTPTASRTPQPTSTPTVTPTFDGLAFAPRVVAVEPGGSEVSVMIRLLQSAPSDTTVTLAVTDPSVASVSAPSVRIAAGDSGAALSVRGLATGSTTVVAVSPAGAAAASIFVRRLTGFVPATAGAVSVRVEDAQANVSRARPLSVDVASSASAETNAPPVSVEAP